MLAMQRAVNGLHIQPDFVRVDGNRCPNWEYKSEAIVKGDLYHAEISAASILAKVTRDREMFVLDKLHPQYGFAAHKGYPTKQHMLALAQYGPIKQHRFSFKPVQLANATR
jgi:ribonuclease HII